MRVLSLLLCLLLLLLLSLPRSRLHGPISIMLVLAILTHILQHLRRHPNSSTRYRRCSKKRVDVAATAMLLLLLLVLVWRIHHLAYTDVVTAHLEQLGDWGTVAMLQDDFVTFGTEFEDIALGPFSATVATHVLADGLEAHGDDCLRSGARSDGGLRRREGQSNVTIEAPLTNQSLCLQNIEYTHGRTIISL